MKTEDKIRKRLEKISICEFCEHIHKNMKTCEAFTEGIPIDISSGGFNHHNKYIGDQGITFKIDEGKLKNKINRMERLKGEEEGS